MSGPPPIAAAIPVETLVLLLIAITAVWAVMSAIVMRRQRRDRELGVLDAQPRRRRDRHELIADEAGTFVPLATAFEEPAEPEPDPEPEPEPEPELELLELPAHPSAIAPARTYEIVWYRDEDRIAFALQPIDGRAASWARYRSASFAWADDCDPPAGLRAAQRAHGRLRARLERDDWVASGRGDAWFRHRFEPPVSAPEPHEDDDEET